MAPRPTNKPAARPRRRAPRKTYHHGDLRRAIMDAALAVAMSEGPHAVTLSHAARVAGVSSGAPFHHFADKAALMRAIVEEGAEHITRLRQEELQKLAGRPASVQRTFLAMGVAHVKFAVRYPAHFRVMSVPELKALSASPEMEMAVFTSEAAMRAIVADPRGATAEASSRLLAAQSLMHGLAVMFVNGQLSREGLSDADIERLVAALGRTLVRP